MALLTTCKNGHSYTASDMYIDWPKGAPHCPICYEQWKATNVAASVKLKSKSKTPGLKSMGFSIGEVKPATLDQLIVGFALQVAQFATQTTDMTDDEIISAVCRAADALSRLKIEEK